MDVGTIGHIDQPTVRIRVVGYEQDYLPAGTLRSLDSAAIVRGQRTGKGQRKANKSKRWN
jgi:hypothetical protein